METVVGELVMGGGVADRTMWEGLLRETVVGGGG
jgi:hypothetical protein